MAKKVLLRDINDNEIMPITRGELILDSSGNPAFHSNEFLATDSQPGLMSPDDKQKLETVAGNTVDTELSNTSTNPVQNKVLTQIINSIRDKYLKSAVISGNKLTITDQSNNTVEFVNSTHQIVTNTIDGLVPKYDAVDGTIDTHTTDWVLTNHNGTLGWYELPANAFKNDNTTYTFVSGNGGFTVTPSGGTAQTVSIGKPATAGTADKLSIPRKIWGQSFDGSGDVAGIMRKVSTIHFGNQPYGERGIYQGNWYAEDLTENDIALNFVRTYFSGNVGIGTTRPSQKLHVLGDTYIEGTTMTYSHQYVRNGGGLSHGGDTYAWYTVYQGEIDSMGDNILLNLSHSYYYTVTDAVTFSINVGYGKAFIVQLNATSGSRIFQKVRVRWVDAKYVFVDVSIYSHVAYTDTIYAFGTGAGKFQKPMPTSDDTGIISESEIIYDRFYASQAYFDAAVIGGNTVLHTGNLTTYFTDGFEHINDNIVKISTSYITDKIKGDGLVLDDYGKMNVDSSKVVTVSGRQSIEGKDFTSQVFIKSGNDAKLVFDNTDDEDKYQYISFRQNGNEYGTLGTRGDGDLRWGSRKVLHEGNYAAVLDIPTVTDYYWANVKISSSSNSDTEPTFATAKATASVTTPLVTNTSILTLNGTSGVYLKYNNTDASSLVLSSTYFKPFDSANNKLTLGSNSARWSELYSVKGNFTGDVTLLSSSGDSPHLIFLRGTTSDYTYDWDQYVTGGIFKLRCNVSGTWNEILSLDRDTPNNSVLSGNRILTLGNSAVSGGGSSGGSSITVNIGGTSKTLTIPTSLPANGGNADTVDSWHKTYFPIGWNGSRHYLILFGLGGLDLNWKKIAETTSNLTTAPTSNNWSGSSIKGKIYRGSDNYSSGLIIEYPFMVTFYYVSGTSLVNTATLYLPKFAKSYDNIRVIRVSTNKFELQVRMTQDWRNDWIEFQGAGSSLTCYESLQTANTTGTVVCTAATATTLTLDTANHAYTATDADTLDGVHANGLLTALSSNTTNAVSITVGGTTKNIAASTLKTSLGLGSNAYSSTAYLPLTGGTLTGPLTLKGELYSGNYALDLKNSNIIGVNSIIMLDLANDAGEGILFKRSNGNHDSIWASDGVLYFSPNGTYGTSTNFPTKHTIYHTGNLTSLPANGGNADTVDGQHFNWNNNKNDHTYLWAASSSGQAYLVHRASMSVNYATSAGSATSATSANIINVTACRSSFNSKLWDDATVDACKVKFWDVYNDEGPYTYGNILEINGISSHWKPQLWFDAYSGQMRVRNRDYNATKFNSWRTILDEVNYTSYTVKKDGTGASGTWGININGTASYATSAGNATTADSATTATTASQLSNRSVASGTNPSTAASGLYVKWYSLVSQDNGYAGNNYGFPASNNANGILWMGTHSGPYGGQLGVSSNGRMYYRFITDNKFPTTANGGSWNVLAWKSEIPTKVSQLTNDSGYLTQHQSLSNYVTLNTALTITGEKTFASNILTISNPNSGDATLKFYRGGNTAWIIVDTGGNLKFNELTSNTTRLTLFETSQGGSAVFGGGIIVPNEPIWVQGGSAAGSNSNRLTTSSGMPTNMQYNTSKRGTQIYANGIAFCDPYNGNSNNDSGWIRHLETTANNGVLEIAMGDDTSNEEIRFRYYNTSNNIAYDILVPRATGTLALTSQIPSSLPANGGNADTVDNLHATSFAIWRGDASTDSTATDTSSTSTADFFAKINATSGLFNSRFGAMRGSWWYVGNTQLNTGVGTLEMAGTAVLNLGSYADTNDTYKSLLFLDQSGRLWSYTANETSVKQWSRYVKTTDKIANASCADGAYYVFDYNATTTPIYIGFANTGLTSTTASYLAAYGTTSSGARCIKDISAAEAKKFIGLGNVQNTAFYQRATAVNGTTWNMAGTTNSAAFTIYAPTTAGTSGLVLTSTGGTPGWTNLSSLSVGYASSAGTADKLNLTYNVGSDGNFPVIWTDTTTTQTAKGSLYKSAGEFYYNPSSDTLTVGNVNGKINGFKISVVDNLPNSPDASTIYFIY